MNRNFTVLLGIIFLLAPAADAQRERMADVTSTVLQQGQVSRGVITVCGADAPFVLEMVEASDLLVHVRDPREDAVRQLREQALEEGIGIDRLVVERGRVTAIARSHTRRAQWHGYRELGALRTEDDLIPRVDALLRNLRVELRKVQRQVRSALLKRKVEIRCRARDVGGERAVGFFGERNPS